MANTSGWNDTAAALLKTFLQSPAGRALTLELASYRPSLRPGVYDLHTRALAGAEVSGFDRCFAALQSLADPVKEKDSSEVASGYPPLDDDQQWPEQPKTP